MVPSETAIHRRNGERINTVQGFVERNVLPEQALQLVQERIAESGLSLPPGYRLEVGGDSDARDETLRNLLGPLGLIIALTIAAIVLTFGSYRLSLVAGLVAIMSMGLSLLALAIFQYPFGIQAVIGVIGSIGVSINAAIIILTALQANAGAMRGDDQRDGGRRDRPKPSHRLDHPDHVRWVPAAHPGRRRILAAVRHGHCRRCAAVDGGVVLLCAAGICAADQIWPAARHDIKRAINLVRYQSEYPLPNPAYSPHMLSRRWSAQCPRRSGPGTDRACRVT